MAGGVAQGVSPEFKPQYCKKKKNSKKHDVIVQCVYLSGLCMWLHVIYGPLLGVDLGVRCLC
jgi:hypothetical protein